MNDRQPQQTSHRLRRTIIQATACILAGGLGMILAHPIVAQFRWSAPWVLPAIAAGILLVLVLIALLVLPRIASRRA